MTIKQTYRSAPTPGKASTSAHLSTRWTWIVPNWKHTSLFHPDGRPSKDMAFEHCSESVYPLGLRHLLDHPRSTSSVQHFSLRVDDRSSLTIGFTSAARLHLSLHTLGLPSRQPQERLAMPGNLNHGWPGKAGTKGGHPVPA